MPNIIPCRLWNYQFSPDAERRARQYPESDGRHPKWDAPVPLPEDWREHCLSQEIAVYADALTEAYTEAERLRVLAVFAADESTDLDAITPGPGDGKPGRVRQFPEPHRWTPASLLDQ